MTFALIGLAYVFVVVFAVSLGTIASRSDRALEQMHWRNRETP